MTWENTAPRGNGTNSGGRSFALEAFFLGNTLLFDNTSMVGAMIRDEIDRFERVFRNVFLMSVLYYDSYDFMIVGTVYLYFNCDVNDCTRTYTIAASFLFPMESNWR